MKFGSGRTERSTEMSWPEADSLRPSEGLGPREGRPSSSVSIWRPVTSRCARAWGLSRGPMPRRVPSSDHSSVGIITGIRTVPVGAHPSSACARSSACSFNRTRSELCSAVPNKSLCAALGMSCSHSFTGIATASTRQEAVAEQKNVFQRPETQATSMPPTQSPSLNSPSSSFFFSRIGSGGPSSVPRFCTFTQNSGDFSGSTRVNSNSTDMWQLPVFMKYKCVIGARQTARGLFSENPTISHRDCARVNSLAFSLGAQLGKVLRKILALLVRSSPLTWPSASSKSSRCKAIAYVNSSTRTVCLETALERTA
mmetsp:Transcript_8750/g.20004  ORF Transcript_8750/g.20004 Transcript_8750/m.20004 type:complete len:312 (-) Transcript_8750:840-1775(-)